MSDGPLIKAYHSSDLTNPCKRAVYHRHRGEIEPSATTALVRGLAAGHALAEIHVTNKWPTTPKEALACADFGMIATVKQVVSEGRPLSETVKRDMAELTREIGTMIEAYSRRQREFFAKCKVIGCEIPVRMTVEIPGREQPAVFESHLDMLYQDQDGQLIIRDFKWHQESAGMDYLGKNMQMALYSLCVYEGWCKVGTSNDDEFDWVQYGRHPFVEWMDLKRLKPFQRKTEHREMDGSVIVYQKGDEQPMNKACQRFWHPPSRHNAIKAEFARHVVMGDANVWPMSPESTRCFLCEAKKWCTSFHKEETV